MAASYPQTTVMQQSSFYKDARYFQIGFQCLLLAYGLLFLQWAAGWQLYAVYISGSVGTQFLADWILARGRFPYARLGNLKSALISALGLCLLLKTNSPMIALLAAVVSIASKYLIRWKGKHIFNPSALGIVVAIGITGDAWVSPGQWGSGMVLLSGILCLGCIVVTKVQKLDLSLAFLGTFTGLLFFRQVAYLGWPTDHFVQSVSTGSLLLFSFFMITDPKTTPNHPIARIVWAMGIAAVAFYLAAFRFMNATPIWVLVAAQPLVPLLDHWFKAKRFQWQNSYTSAAVQQQA
jgi:Na+-transporting NADH:ubiquinone oxidoreductase subunit NqrB